MSTGFAWGRVSAVQYRICCLALPRDSARSEAVNLQRRARSPPPNLPNPSTRQRVGQSAWPSRADDGTKAKLMPIVRRGFRLQGNRGRGRVATDASVSFQHVGTQMRTFFSRQRRAGNADPSVLGLLQGFGSCGREADLFHQKEVSAHSIATIAGSFSSRSKPSTKQSETQLCSLTSRIEPLPETQSRQGFRPPPSASMPQ